jgi:Protein of unknown function (DUF3616)
MWCPKFATWPAPLGAPMRWISSVDMCRLRSFPIGRPAETGACRGALPFSRRTCSALGVALLVLSAGLPFAAWSQEAQTWPVRHRLLGKDGAKSEDVSGIACARQSGFPRPCLVIDDELQSAQFVVVDDGELRAGSSLPLIANEHDNKPLELDGEGVAYFDGAFYVIGSHGHPRDKKMDLNPIADKRKIDAKIAASSQIIRIQMKPSAGMPMTASDVAGIQRSSKLREIIAADPTLKPFVNRRLEDNGATIEGIAIVKKRIFVGFRAPVLNDSRAPILSVPLDAIFGEAQGTARLHAIPLREGSGVRDLAAYDDGILILAGPSGDGAGRYDVYWWDGDGEDVRHLANITKAVRAGAGRKPEAILPLDRDDSGLRVLILSDGAEEGEPHVVVVPFP